MSNDFTSTGEAADAARLRSLGSTLRRQGRLDEAAAALRHALKLSARDALAWCELAHVLRWQDKFADARDAADRAIGLDPGLAPAWFNFAAALVELEEVERGIEAYLHALRLDPSFAEAWSNLGLVYGSQGRNDEAIAALQRALDANPRLVPVWNNLGGIFSAQGRHADAIDAYHRALALDPDYAQGWSNLAEAGCMAGQYSEAIAAAERAIAIEPAFAAAWHNLGTAKSGLGEFETAVTAYRRAVELDPQSAQSWSALGTALLRLGSGREAVTAHEHAARVAPNDPRSWRNFGQALWVANRQQDAVAAMRRAIALQPQHAGIRADLVYQLMALCEWDDLDQQLALLGTSVDAMPAGEEETPHGNLMRCNDEACNLALARRWADRISARFPPTGVTARVAQGDGRITIGYLSSDIHDHATAYLMRGVFRLHDHEKFRINVYSHGPDDGSIVRAEIRQACDIFRDIRKLDHSSAAAQIAADGVDILVDLKGWTQGIRYEICAQRPAPVQMTYLGFPGSCGAPFIDYALVDATVVPHASACFYTEHLIYLPHCYQANDNEQPIAESAVSRGDFGLPATAAVLCSFNCNQKIEPVVFAAWMRILKAAPGAVLWLLESNPHAAENLRSQARRHGVDAGRLIFAKIQPRPQHLRRLQLADIALDTLICNGHTTTSDALWAGIPVLTLRGRHFASRVSASCLGAIGMPELVAGSLQEYEDLAVRFATDQDFLRGTRVKLQQNRRSTPLFDTLRFTRNLERTYAQAWQWHQSGRPPQSFSVHDAERSSGL